MNQKASSGILSRIASLFEGRKSYRFFPRNDPNRMACRKAHKANQRKRRNPAYKARTMRKERG